MRSSFAKLAFLFLVHLYFRKMGFDTHWCRRKFRSSTDTGEIKVTSTWLTVEIPLEVLYSTVDISLSRTPTFQALWSLFPERYVGQPLARVAARHLDGHLFKFEKFEETLGEEATELGCLVTPIGPAPRLMILDGRHRATMNYFRQNNPLGTVLCHVHIRRSNLRFFWQWWPAYRSKSFRIPEDDRDTPSRWT